MTPVVDGGPAPGVALAAAVLEALGVDEARVAEWIAARRAQGSAVNPEMLVAA